MRHHPKVKSLPFKAGLKKTDRVNARVRYIEGDMTEHEFKGFVTENYAKSSAWSELFTTQPEALTDQDKADFLKTLSGVAVSSDAFFPFRDSIDQASKYGVSYVAQPAGSIADEEVIGACNEYKMVMLKSKHRLFHH